MYATAAIAYPHHECRRSLALSRALQFHPGLSNRRETL
jgi:hypothetical protein